MNVLAAMLLLIAAQGESLDLPEYRARLRRIQDAVERRDLDAATSGARELLQRRIQTDGMVLLPDATVLGPLAEAKTIEDAREASRPLRALSAELEAADAGPRPAPPDGALLERLRQEEQLRQISPDKAVGGPVLQDPHIPQSFWDRLASLWESIEKLLQRFLRWLAQMFFGSSSAQTGVPGPKLLVIGLVIVLVATLGAVAFVALRRRRGAPDVVASSEAPAMSAEDADPLSRTANEWERFAAELMKAGRFREAIRAWYHALLVSLFRAGTLHYRKDRTNWEYAYALPSTVPWRSGFMDATRTFEQEWYGRRDTPGETAEIYRERAIEMLDAVREGVAR